MSSRKPPSHGPERKLDETARAIAQARAAVVADKAAESSRSGRDEASVPDDRGGRGAGRRIGSGPNLQTSTKRPKQP